jgi:hypothetical protein
VVGYCEERATSDEHTTQHLTLINFPPILYILLYSNNAITGATFSKKPHISLQIQNSFKERFSYNDDLLSEREWIFTIESKQKYSCK